MTVADHRDTDDDTQSAARTRTRFSALLVVMVVGFGLVITVAGALLLPPGDDPGLLFSSDDGTVTRLDPTTGETQFSLTDAVLAPDGSTVYRIERDDSPTLQEIDPATGDVRSEKQVAPQLEVRTVGLNGTAAVLIPAGRRGDLYTPESREETDLTVVWNDDRPPKEFHLAGNFEPETFTVDGSALYLLEFQPPTDPDHYTVRKLDLGTGEVSGVYSPGVDLNPEMRGYARAQVLDPKGTYMYTLYTVGSGGDPLTDEEGAVRYGFVHVISLETDWSYCIFLPIPMGARESAMGMAMDRDGGRLYVSDSEAQMVAEIDTSELTVTRNVKIETTFPEAYTSTPMAASTSAGRLFLAGKHSVYALDTDTLEPTMGWSTDSVFSTIDDIRISEDGTELWVLTGRQVKVVNLSSMNVTHEIVAPLPGREPGFAKTDGGEGGFTDIGDFFCAC